MRGLPAEVLDWNGNEGHVFAHGERWQARGAETFKPGETVEVANIVDLTLLVRRGTNRRGRYIMMLEYLTYAALALLVIMFLSQAIRILREYERGVIFTLGRFTGVKGPGLIILIPIVQQTGEGRSAGDGAGRAAAGRDFAGQRLRQGQRRSLLPHRRSRTGHHQGRRLHGRHQPARPDHAALGARQARARRDACRARQVERATSRRSSTSRPTSGASRSPASRSRTSISTKPWCARLPNRPRRSGCGGPR